MNANYMRGRRAEYAAKKLLESWGYTVIRAAGSKGPYDLVAILPKEHVWGVQIKTTSSKTVARSLLRAFNKDGGVRWSGFESKLWVLLAGKWYRNDDYHDTELWD